MQSWHAMMQSRIFYDLDMKNAWQLQKTLAISIDAFHVDLKKRTNIDIIFICTPLYLGSSNTSPYVQ